MGQADIIKVLMKNKGKWMTRNEIRKQAGMAINNRSWKGVTIASPVRVRISKYRQKQGIHTVHEYQIP